MYREMTVVGKGIPLQDGYLKVSGRLKFATDRSVAGGLCMKILRSPYPHAKIKSIDTGKAEALPGIKAVLTHKDVPQRKILCAIYNWEGRILEDRVRFVGDEVAAVAGETEEIAEEALDLIDVEYEKLPAVFDIEEALKPDAPDVRGIGYNKVSCPPDRATQPSCTGWGDIKEGFEKADATVENEVRTHSTYGGFFPPACIAEWEDDKLTLTMPHHCPHEIRAVTADVLDMPEHKVRIIAPQLACSFGMLNSSQRFWNIAALLARKASRPVIYKMTLDEYGLYKRRESDIMRVKLGGKKDGTVTALDYTQIHDNGGYGRKVVTYQRMHDIFHEASVRYNAFGVCTNKFSSGCIRGVGSIPQAMALNQAIDMLSEKLGVDPLTLWKKCHHKAGDPIHAGHVQREARTGLEATVTVSSEAYDELIDKGAKAIDWEKKWQGWGKPYEAIGAKRRGVGIAVSVHSSGSPSYPSSAIVQMNHDGTAQILAGSMDFGSGCKTTFAQICAETLGLKVEDVYVVKDVDTETVPYSVITGASASLHIGGSAVKKAAEDAKQQLLETAYNAPSSPDILKKGIKTAEELDIKDSMIYVKADPSRKAAVKEVVSNMLGPMVIGRALRHDISVWGPRALMTMATFADVEVDTETGRVEVLKLVIGSDAGRIINPEVCQNQLYGGSLMSLGYSLMEEIVFDPATGQVLNPALANYWVPTSLDVPSMETIFSENIDPIGPFGAKGIGEAPTICPPAAIAGATYNAIGVRISKLPITPEKILKALGKIG